jgi:O-antigen ligase
MTSRWELIRRGFICFLENPILGVGLNCFPSFQGRRWGLWFPPHNTYIQALAEMGIFGFGIFIYIVFNIFKNIILSKRMLRQSKIEDVFLNQMVRILIVSFIIRVILSFFGQELYDYYWWVTGGLSLVLLRITKEKYKSTSVNCQIQTG